MSEVLPLVSWETQIYSPLPVQGEDYHYTCNVAYVNPNDYSPGVLGTDQFYIVDYLGKIFQIKEILDINTGKVKIYDLTEGINGPYVKQNAFVYQARKYRNTLTQAQRKRLHPTAFDLIWNIENNLRDRNIDYVIFDKEYVSSDDPEPEGKVWWNSEDDTLTIAEGYNSILRVGQEIHIKVYNNSGGLINKGTAVYPTGAYNNYPTIGKAKTDTHENVAVDYGMTTVDIPDGSYGFVKWFGKVDKVDTSLFNVGDRLWISSTNPGEVTNIRPLFPAYAIQIGIVFIKDAINGQIFVTSRDTIRDTIQNFWNGSIRESLDFLITSDGAIITGSLTPSNGHPDLTMMFSDGFTMLDTSPAATIQLTPGSDDIPQTNFVYIPISTKILTVSTSDWPSEEHIKIATIVLRSALKTQTDGALRNQNWNDHIQSTDNNQGHLAHICERIRQEHTKWDSGVEPSLNIVSASDPDDVYVAVTSGKVYQMHKQTFPAMNMATGDDIHVVNDSISPFKTINNLNLATLDAQGNALTSRYFSFVVWGIQNKTGEKCHLMLNLPTNSYNSSALAISDPSNYSVYTIPKQFQGVGFLIARFTFNLSPSGSGTWTLIDTQDLRGYIPNMSAGGSVGGGGVSTFLGLTDTPNAYVGNAYKLLQVGPGEAGLEYTSDIKVDSIYEHTLNAGVTIETALIKDGRGYDVDSTAPTVDNQWANKKYVDDNSASITYGTDNQIPYVNATNDNFDYSNNLQYDGTVLTLRTDGTDQSVYIGLYAASVINKTANRRNIAIGDNAMVSATTASDTVSLGSFSGGGLTVGTKNTFVGSYSGDSITYGNRNTYVGANTGGAATGADGGVFIGYMAGFYEQYSDKLFIDNQDRLNETDSRVKSLVYGEFNSTVASQLFRINGQVELPQIGAKTTETNVVYYDLTTGELSYGAVSSGGYWTQTGNDIYYTTGNVGIGTSTFDTTLNILSSGVNGIKMYPDSSSANNSARLFFANSGGIWTIANFLNTFSIRSNATIGTTSGTERFKIDSNGDTFLYGDLTIQSTTSIDSILDEDDMASNSATALATQQSIKAYITSLGLIPGFSNDAEIIYDAAGALTGNSKFKLTNYTLSSPELYIQSTAYAHNANLELAGSHECFTHTAGASILSIFHNEDSDFYISSGGKILERDLNNDTIIYRAGTEKIRLDSGEIDIADDVYIGAYDFSVDSGLLFADASANCVGINDSTPSYSLDVNGTGRFTTRVGIGTTPSSVNGLTVLSNSASGFAATFQNDGNDVNRYGIKIQCGLDTLGSAYPVRFYDGNGTYISQIAVTSTVTAFSHTSDRRLKAAIEDYDIDGLRIVDKMQYRSFYWKRDENKERVHGWIAQEVEKIYPEMVNEDPTTGYKTVADATLIPVLMDAVKKLHVKINEQNDIIFKLKERIEHYESNSNNS